MVTAVFLLGRAYTIHLVCLWLSPDPQQTALPTGTHSMLSPLWYVKKQTSPLCTHCQLPRPSVNRLRKTEQGSNTVAHIWHACAQCLVPHSLSENTIEQIQRLLLHSDLPVHCWTECSMTATPSVIPVMMNTTIHQKGMHLVTLAITTHWCEARGEILALEIEKVHE